MKIDKTVQTTAPVDQVFAFLADFTTTEQWDPGTVRTRRVSGDGGEGTTYANTSRFLGRETELTYVVTEHRPNERISLRGENKTVIAHDTMTITASADGTQVRYEADFQLKGWARLTAPFLAPAFAKLGNDGAREMHKVLDRLASVD